MEAHAPTSSGSERQMLLIMHLSTEVLKQVSKKKNGSSVFAGSDVLMDYLTFKCAILNHSVTVAFEMLINI